MKSKTCSRSKQALDKNQSSKFYQSGVKQTHFQNLKIIDHSSTLTNYQVRYTAGYNDYLKLNLAVLFDWTNLSNSDSVISLNVITTDLMTKVVSPITSDNQVFYRHIASLAIISCAVFHANLKVSLCPCLRNMYI